jgi:diphosphomevalonate decarboxylase
MDICRRAILERDFEALAEIVELDSSMMHAVIMTSQPPLMYWNPATLAIMRAVSAWREEGLPACFTIDAGPNVHVITLAESSNAVQARLQHIPGVLEVITARPGGPAYLLPTP